MTPYDFDSSNPTPLYFQLQELLVKMIDEGEYKVGDPLPSEQKLIEDSGLSRTTVRQAIKNLVNQGILEKRRGVGTFVCERKRHQWNLDTIQSFRDAAVSEGRSCRTKQLSIELVDHDDRATEVYGDEIGRVYRIERLRYIDDLPAILVTTFVPERYTPGLEHFNLSERSLYDVMRREYGLTIDHADKILRAQPATATDAPMLGIEPGAPVQSVRTVAFNELDQPIEFSISRDRGDISTYRVHINHRNQMASNG